MVHRRLEEGGELCVPQVLLTVAVGQGRDQEVYFIHIPSLSFQTPPPPDDFEFRKTGGGVCLELGRKILNFSQIHDFLV